MKPGLKTSNFTCFIAILYMYIYHLPCVDTYMYISIQYTVIRNKYIIIEGNLNSKLPTIWRVEKQMKSRWDEVKSEERRCNCAKVRRKKIHPRQMLEKSRNAVFFQWFVCRVSQKVGSLKRRVRSHVVRGEIKNCTPLWREAHFQSICASRYMFGPLFEVEMWKNGTPL